MPDRDLTINLRFVKQAAERAAQEFHQGERRRIRQTGELFAAEFKTRAALTRQFFKEEADAQNRAAKAAKGLLDARGRLIKRLAKDRADAEKKAIKDVGDAEKRAAKDAAALLKTRMALSNQFFRQYSEGVKQAEKDEASANRRSARAAKALFETRKALSRQFFLEYSEELKRAAAEEAALLKKTQKEEADAKKKEEDTAKAVFKTRSALSQQRFNEEAERQREYTRVSEEVSKRLNQIAIEDHKEKRKQEEASAKQAIAAAHEEIDAENKARKEGRLKELREAMAATLKRVEATEQVARDAEASGQAYIDNDRKVRQIRREAEDADATRKFVSNEGFKQERARKEAEKTGVVQRSESKKTTNALDEQQKTILRVSTAYTTMRVAAEVGQAIRTAMEAVNESLRNSRSHIEEMVRSTERLRDEMAEILALQGKPISSAATAEELGGFAKLGLTPQQGIAAQKSFRENAQGMIGAGKAFRMTPEQSGELLGFAAKVAASQGMEVAPAEELMSTLISKADIDKDTGKVNTQAVKEQFARNMNLFRNERGSTALDVRQAAVAIQKHARNSADIDRLAVMTAAQAEVQPGTTRVHIDALIRGLEQLDEEKRERLGIRLGMTGEQKLAAATKAIPRIAKEEFSGDEGVAIRGLAFNDEREATGFEAHLRAVREGIYERVAAEQKAGSAAKSEAAYAEFKRSEGGVSGRQQSEKAAAEARRAAHYRKLTEARRAAAIKLTQAGYGEEPEGFFAAIGTRAGAQFGMAGSDFEQETERRALAELKAGLEQSAEGRNFLRDHPRMINRLNPNVLDPAASESLKAEGYNKLREIQSSGDGGNGPAAVARERRKTAEAAANEDAMRRLGVTSEETAIPLPARAGVRFSDTPRMPHHVVLPPREAMLDLMREESRGRRGRGRRIELPGANGRMGVVLPGANGRISRRFRHGYVGQAPNSVIGPVPRRATGPADAGMMGRVGAGVAHSGGMFAMDPAHEMARLQIVGNHNFLGRYQERREATEADMASRRAGMAQNRNDIAAALRSAMGIVTPQIPASMPSKPTVMRN